MKKFSLVCFILSVSFFTGCASQKPMYYWGDYSSSLYDYKKNANDESLGQHMAVLENIIKESGERNLRVPPGVCVEYGYLLAKSGKKEEALKYFDMEEQIYPESQDFLKRLKSQLNVAEE